MSTGIISRHRLVQRTEMMRLAPLCQQLLHRQHPAQDVDLVLAADLAADVAHSQSQVPYRRALPVASATLLHDPELRPLCGAISEDTCHSPDFASQEKHNGLK
jgi:hypothetical protein